jgi:hypothetical protein
VRGPAYPRVRAAFGLAGMALGAVILWRTFFGIGLDWKGLPAYVLGLALIGLGVAKWRDYRAAVSSR